MINNHCNPFSKQHWYPFLVNSTIDIICPSKSPVLNKRALVRVIKSEDVLSIGDINPVGTKGNWIITLDIYGDKHEQFMSHMKNHFSFFEKQGKKIFALQFNIPYLANIETTRFYKELSMLKSGEFWFTPNFVNQLK